MCGIFGWIGDAPEAPRELAAVVSRLLQHRGPDDEGFESGAGWGLGFRRLSILDLSSTGHQPMSTPDGRFWIVFNGEIYNYLELREELEQNGEAFRGSSDTEVLLTLFAREGARALERLNGMFALAAVDLEQRTFLLARDRLGVKPLYFRAGPGQLRFSSELKGLLAWPDAPREIDPVALAEYLALNYLSSENCIFRGYRKLVPGHFLQGRLDDPHRAETVRYWRLELNGELGDDHLPERELDELQKLLEDAVRVRLRSDVPVGIFLSGGLDSGLVSALAAKASSGRQPLALTIGFSEEKYDETQLARATVGHVGLEHRLLLQPASGLSDVDRMAWFYDEPFGDVSALPTFALSRAAAEHGTVFLAGDGGDEAFAGYRRYVEGRRHRWLVGLPAWAGRGLGWLSGFLPEASLIRSRLLKMSLPDAGYAGVFDTLPEDPVLSWLRHPDWQMRPGDGGRLLWEKWAQARGDCVTARQQWLDYSQFLPDDILVKVDRASMAHSIEIRSPFLDYRVVEWAARLPRATLLDSRQGKLPLRRLGARLLPPAVETARKHGFGAPVGRWFRAPAGQALVRERLLSREAARYGLWNPQGVERLNALHLAGGGRDFGSILWRLLMLEAWARQYASSTRFLEGPPTVPSVSPSVVTRMSGSSRLAAKA